MDSTPNGKAVETDDASIVRAHEQHAPGYEQVASAEYRRITRSDGPETKYTSNEDATKPNNVLIASADERLAHAYERIASVDAQIARVAEQLSKLEHNAARPRSSAPGRRRSAARGIIGVLLASCVFATALVWHSSYGEAAKTIIARWAPSLGLTSSAPPGKQELAAQPSRPSPRMVDAEATPPKPSAQNGSQEGAPAAVPLSPELVAMLPTMARNVADMQRRIEQLDARQEQMSSDNANAIGRLKSSQEEMASSNAKALDELKASQDQTSRDNAVAFEQLKASQEQVTRDNAKAAEQLKAMASFAAKVSKPSSQPKASTPPARPIAGHQAVSTRPSPPARLQP